MNIHLHIANVNVHMMDDKHAKAILEGLNLITKKLDKMGQELDDLKAAVAKNTEVEQSAVTLITGLKEKLDAAIASGDPAQLTALSTELGSSSDALAAAVTANTPVDTANNG